MSTNTNHGFSQQAFPTWIDDNDSMAPGMALVDFYAAHALAITSKDTPNRFEAARNAFELADAMMIARHEYHMKHQVPTAPTAPTAPTSPTSNTP